MICSSVHWLATLLGQVTPVSTHNVQAFELLFGGVFAISLRLNHQCCIFLLLQQQKRLKHAIDVNLQEFIEFIHLAFHLHRHIYSIDAGCRMAGLILFWLSVSITCVRLIYALKIRHSIFLWGLQKTPSQTYLVPQFKDLLQVGTVGVDHDGVGIPVYDLQIHLRENRKPSNPRTAYK